MGWQWHQLDHMQIICTLLQTAPSYSILYRPDVLPDAEPTVSKHWRPKQQQQVVKVIWQQAASLPHMDDSMVFARWHHCAPHLIHVLVGPHESKSQTASRSVHPFLHSSQKNRYTLQRAASFCPLKFPLSMGDLDIHLIHGSLGQPKSLTQTGSRSVQLFLHSSSQSVPILYNGPTLPPQNFPFPRGMDMAPHDSVGHLSPQPKWYLDQFSRFCRAHYCDKTDRPIDHANWSVTIGRIWVHSAAMWPDNNNNYNNNIKVNDTAVQQCFTKNHTIYL